MSEQPGARQEAAEEGPPPAHAPIHGSCLCQSVQYEVRFPEEGSWPPKRNSCHCPQCRHMSGALSVHLITVPAASLSIYDPTLSLHEYASSSFARRAFCVQCGSSLFWRKPPRSSEDSAAGMPGGSEGRVLVGGRTGHGHEEGKTTQVGEGEYASDEGIDVFIGTLNEKWLTGEDGRVLATPADGVLWAGDAVPGVTDHRADGEGTRWSKGRDTEEL